MPQIPNKLYFRIGEVSDLVGVKPYVLRYWESEFTDIKPSKSKSGQRLYKRRDVELLLLIKELLYEERFTINGARKRLKEHAKREVGPAVPREPVEEEPTVQREEGPQQLEVFADDPIDEDPAVPALGQAGALVGRTSIKAFQKIRRDLEDLLTVVKS